MKTHVTFLVFLAFLTSNLSWATGKIQNEDVKSVADLIAAGADATHAINDTKIWSTTVFPPQLLSTAISTGVIGGGGGGSGKNYLLNPSYEGGLTSHTVATATGSVDAVNFTDGTQSAKLTFAASLGSILQDVTPVTTLAGVNLQASCFVSTSQVGVQLCARSGGVEVGCQAVPSGGSWQPVAMNFVGPSLGTSIGYSVKATSTITGTVNIDQCYLGKATNLSQVSQAQLLGTVTVTGCASTWQDSAFTSYTDFPAQTGCVYTTSGSALAPSTQIPGISFANLGAGEYSLEYEGVLQNNIAAHDGAVQFWDGTNTAREQSYVGGSTSTVSVPTFKQSISYTTPKSNVTFSIRSKISAGGQLNLYGVTFTPGVIRVYYYPAQSQLAYTPNTTTATWNGGLTGGNWTNTSGSITDFTNAGTSAIVSVKANNISCVPESNGYPGITCQLPVAATYKVCAYAGISAGLGSAIGSYILADGSNNQLSPTIQQYQFPSAGQPAPVTICANVPVASAGPFTFKIRGNSSAGVIAYVFSPSMNWDIQNISQNIPAPVLVGGLSTLSSGAMGIVTAKLSAGGSIASQTGSWISTGSGSTGDITYPITAGTFSAAPFCTVSTSIANNNQIAGVTVLSSTAVEVSGRINGAGTLVNADSNLMCIGPK